MDINNAVSTNENKKYYIEKWISGINKNLILLTYIKEFTNNLYEIFYDDENLYAYKLYLDDTDILNEKLCTYIVNNFLKNSMEFKKTRIQRGMYINLPKFLENEDENTKIIKESIMFISEINENIMICPELRFLETNISQYYENVKLDECDEAKKMINILESNYNVNDENIKNKSEEIMPILKNILISKILPEFNKKKEEFNNNNLRCDLFLRILLVILYENMSQFNSREINNDEKQNKQLDEKSKELNTIRDVIHIYLQTPKEKLSDNKTVFLEKLLSLDKIQKMMSSLS